MLYIFIMGLGGLIIGKKAGRKVGRNPLLVFGVCMSCIAIFDSMLGMKYTGEILIGQKRPPLMMTKDQDEIVRISRKLRSGTFLYLKDHSNPDLVGDFEYAIMSLSPQKGYFGHPIFSPFIKDVAYNLYIKHRIGLQAERLLQRSDYIIIDRKLSDKFDWQSMKMLYKGKELIFYKRKI